MKNRKILYVLHALSENFECLVNVLLCGNERRNPANHVAECAAGKEKKILHSTRIGSETTPIVANGVVYAAMNGRLWALAL